MPEVISTVVEAHIFRKKGNNIEFLAIKRAPKDVYPNLWQPVTGSIEQGEKAFQAAIREVKEETNIDVERLWVVPIINSYYSKVYDRINLITVFAALASEQSEVIISEEHTDFKWVTLNEAEEIYSWLGQRNSAKIIDEYFGQNGSTYYLDEVML